MPSIEDEIAGSDVEAQFDANEYQEALRKLEEQRLVLTGAIPPPEVKIQNEQEKAYEKQHTLEIKSSWLRIEGTIDFINKLELDRQNLIKTAEDSMIIGQVELANRCLIQSKTIRNILDKAKSLKES